ncbi:MFS transporter [Streptococcus equi]|uniref:MFS transporter n=1 Tax=Streptococcus equi TaxID=1336 RepID=UPI0024ACCC33|nr:MFS transporter [Streptococcus equi]MDI5916203.1 MFS transporter [Streptococcus equi subsp. zooepidemicus]
MRFQGLTSNFYNLIFSRSSRNIADSFYMIALSVGLLKVYNINAGELSFLTLVGLLPNMLSFAYGSLIHNLKNDKKWLIVFQMIQLIVIISIIICLSYQLPVVVMYVLNLAFNLVTTVLNTIQMKIVPRTLDDDSDLIEKSVDIQYATSNVLDIVSNFVGSVLLSFVSYLVLLQLSLPFFIGAIAFIFRIQLSPSKLSTTTNDEIEKPASVTESLRAFRESTFASFIILVEAFLSGGTDLLLALLPLYLLSEGISIEYIGLVLAAHRAADLLGALVAPRIKVSPRSFFFIDYILSGSSFLLCFMIPYPMVKLLLFFITFTIIGISGNVFEKMIYNEYNHNKLALVYTTNATLYAVFDVLFLLIPFVYSDIRVIGILINSLTIMIGFGLLIVHLQQERK